MSPTPQYAVRCGSLYLGANERNPLVNCIERARAFTTFAEAESAAAELRGRGASFVMPWKAEPLIVAESAVQA